jgi:ectoine hydroxylase-related dioxygenase (phytanoyl-CoA dioxygenase family)
MLPRITFTNEELATGTPGPEKIQTSVELFKQNGTLLFENAFPPALIYSLNVHFQAKYKDYFHEQDTLDALTVGNRRKMITVEVEGPFNNPGIYANPCIFPIIKGILGERIILNGHGGVIALPGSATQHTHRDYTGLFLDEVIDSTLPPFALTVVIPLIPIDATVGGTRVWPGSHNATEQQCRTLEYSDPIMPLGSCLFMDYMLVHAGQANKSDRIRPIMYNIYSRPWFRDDANYVKQHPLRISDMEYARVPALCRQLFSWVKMTVAENQAVDPQAPCPCGSGRNYYACHGKIF